MSYDIYLQDAWGEYLGAITYTEEEALWKLCRLEKSRFLDALSARFYTSYTYSLAEIKAGEEEIRQLVITHLNKEKVGDATELSLLYKLWAILQYALAENSVIRGEGD